MVMSQMPIAYSCISKEHVLAYKLLRANLVDLYLAQHSADCKGIKVPVQRESQLHHNYRRLPGCLELLYAFNLYCSHAARITVAKTLTKAELADAEFAAFGHKIGVLPGTQRVDLPVAVEMPQRAQSAPPTAATTWTLKTYGDKLDTRKTQM